MILRKAIQGSLVRMAFLFHGLAGVFVLVYFTQVPLYFVLGMALFLFSLELFTTLRCNEKGEWRWLIPVVFLYIAMVVAVVWFTELSLLEFRSSLVAMSGGDCPDEFITMEALSDDCKDVYAGAVRGVTQEELDKYNFGQTFSTIFQQTFMLVLILGRWLLPLGGMTREELSQLLLVYVAMAADMLEFSIETLRLREVACERPIFLVILAVWSWSLLQFAFGQAVSRKRSQRLIGRVVKLTDSGGDSGGGAATKISCSTYLCGSEVRALFTDVLLQDGPYLIIRAYLIITYSITSNILLFFALKNLLQLVMQFYRIAVLLIDTEDEAKRRRGTVEELGLSVLFSLQDISQQNRTLSLTPPSFEGDERNGPQNVAFEEENEDVV